MTPERSALLICICTFFTALNWSAVVAMLYLWRKIHASNTMVLEGMRKSNAEVIATMERLRT